MSEFQVQIPVVHQHLDDGLWLSEAVGFAELSCLAETARDAAKSLKNNVAELLDETTGNAWARRWLPEVPQPFEVRLTLAPAVRAAAWQEPVELTFPAVRWRQADDAWVAFIPGLGIEVLASCEEELSRCVEQQVLAALRRIEATKSLKTLALAQRTAEIEVEVVTTTHEIKSPKRAAQDDEAGREQRESVLDQIGTNLAKMNLAELFERDAELDQLAELLTGRHPRSVLLVGPSGVGKTAIARGLVRQRKSTGISVWETGGSRIVAGMSGFGMWQERCRHLLEEVAKRRSANETVVLHIGPLLELMEVGQYEGNSQGIANFLRPAISRSELLVIAECTPEQLVVFERRDPHVLHAFAQLRIDEPSVEQGRRLLEQVARSLWRGSTSGPDRDGLETLDRLHRRYATYSAYPGRPLRFLRALRQEHSTADGPITAARVTTAFARETGLPLWLLNDVVRTPTSGRANIKCPDVGVRTTTAEVNGGEALHDWFAARVIGQPESVTAVTDLLAVIKAGLHRERKPLASFLLIGPTGVGKTEMSKALAEFLFSDSQRMVRVDLSEYADELAVQRLIGGTISDEGWLTSRVREQPFAVVLLDEFEKAHPAFFDLLLQVLSDGRLTDAAGRVADFRNCVIIMTSNLGAATFQKGSVGFAGAAADRMADRDHFVKAVREFVRPELFNRVDAVVPFGAIDEATARRIVERQLQLLRRRDGWIARRLAIDIAPDVVEHLLRTGFDRRYGARSLKRVLERELLAPLSEQLNGYSGDTALRGEISVSGDRLRVVVKAQVAESGRTIRSLEDEIRDDVSLPRIRDLRRKSGRLMNSAAAVELRNQLFRIARLEAKQLRSRKLSPDAARQLGEQETLRSLVNRIEQQAMQAVDLEESSLLRLYDASHIAEFADGSQTETPRGGDGIDALEESFCELLFDVHERSLDNPKVVRLALYGEQRAWRQLLGAYLTVVDLLQARVEAWRLAVPDGPRESPPPEHWNSNFMTWTLIEPKDRLAPGAVAFWRLKYQRPESPAIALLEAHRIKSPQVWLNTPVDESLGVVLSLSGPRCFARFVGESGAHAFVFPSEKRRCVVETALGDWKSYLPPRGFDRKGGLDGYQVRREYDEPKSQLTDSDTSRPIAFSRSAFNAAVAAMLEARHVRDAEGVLE